MSSPPEPEQVDDPAKLKALTHPRRLRILNELRHGPATATRLARALGENSGATSYHLRRLAEHGYVEETEGPARGRERWWRLRPHDLRFPPRSEQSPALRAQVDEFGRQKFQADLDLFARFQQQRESMGDWGDALPFSRGTLHLTRDEVGRFFEDYLALLRRYWRSAEEIPPEARALAVRFVAFPIPETEEPVE
ncbi:ArsR/SmtB family transcription factor [Amycolatopsis magusensis]|uniref:DNA-binding transcriptional ArsR family regulator n=1 Tax=Amycolatopsis magusensis TaxID=882444 RepID=A0ABS4PR74_9PSEU|nr:winged helix-turn-helix domain-containing protein [Amycolatopsis magusensis]MBP2181930.1 DNA-binding transcriptional ArsR family regulator [Amycolatopsis magusensis]